MQFYTSKVWHLMNPEAVAEQLQSSFNGLTSTEATRRFEQFGGNYLPQSSTPHYWQILLVLLELPWSLLDMGLSAASA